MPKTKYSVGAFAQTVHDGVTYWANKKNIALSKNQERLLAEQIVRTQDKHGLDCALRCDFTGRSDIAKDICETLDVHATRQFADLYLTTFPIQTDEVGYSFICRIAGRLLLQRARDDVATWPNLSAHSLLPYLETRSDGVFTQWSDRRRPSSLSYHHGFLLDRPSEDGPALHFECGDGAQELEYWQRGRRHRDPAEGPAVFKIHGQEDGTRREEYYIERTKPAEGTTEFSDWMTKMSLASGKAEVIIGKQRHGPVGTVELSFEGQFTRFSNLARDYMMPER